MSWARDIRPCRGSGGMLPQEILDSLTYGIQALVWLQWIEKKMAILCNGYLNSKGATRCQGASAPSCPAQMKLWNTYANHHTSSRDIVTRFASLHHITESLCSGGYTEKERWSYYYDWELLKLSALERIQKICSSIPQWNTSLPTLRKSLNVTPAPA